MRVLVTGGAGQVGSYLIEHLLPRHEVAAVDVSRSGILAVNSVLEHLDLRDRDAVFDRLPRAEAIVHCAAHVSVEGALRDPAADAQHNILGTLNVLDAALRRRCERFVYISSAAVYGNPERLPVGEGHPMRPMSPYGASKLAGEIYSFAYHRCHELPVVAIRPFNIYSARANPLNPYSGVITKFIWRVKERRPLVIEGNGTQTRDFVHVSDVVRCIELALSSDRAVGEVVNCGTGKPTSIQELAELIIELAGSPVPIEHAEGRVGDIATSYADLARARELLGYEPKVTLRSGLPELLL